MKNDKMELVENWYSLCYDLFYDNNLDIEKFKKIFVETWKYIIEQNCEIGVVTMKVAEILGYIKAFQSCSVYPCNISSAEFETCTDFADGLFFSTVKNTYYEGMTLSCGWIIISKYRGRWERNVHIDNFDDAFDMILKMNEGDDLV